MIEAFCDMNDAFDSRIDPEYIDYCEDWKDALMQTRPTLLTMIYSFLQKLCWNLENAMQISSSLVLVVVNDSISCYETSCPITSKIFEGWTLFNLKTIYHLFTLLSRNPWKIKVTPSNQFVISLYTSKQSAFVMSTTVLITQPPPYVWSKY